MSLIAGLHDIDPDFDGVDDLDDVDGPLAPVTPLHGDARAAGGWAEPDPRDRAPEFRWSDGGDADDRPDDDPDAEWDDDDPDAEWDDDDPDAEWDGDQDAEWDDDAPDAEWDDHDPDAEWDDDQDVEWDDDDPDAEWDDDDPDAEWDDDRHDEADLDDDGPRRFAGRPARLGLLAAVSAAVVTTVLVIGSGGSDPGTADTDSPASASSPVRSGPERAGGRVQPATPDAPAPDDATTGAADPATGATPTTPGVGPTVDPAAAPATATGSVPIDPSVARPEPVQAVFAPGLITLSGSLPSAEAADHLEALARANSTSPGALVNRFITIDPSLPTDIDVRVIELDSVRFADGSDLVSDEHAAQLDRVAAVLDALPHVDVLVIGHSDQRGDEDRNYALSVDRAQSVVDHLVSRGIAPSRLSARAVGEADLLSLDDDEAALALNRRTEFVFSGIFAPLGERTEW